MTVNQLMRGILFPLGNTVFYAQADDPAALPRDPMPSASTKPLTCANPGAPVLERRSGRGR
jgi:hypothetical protein